MIEFIDIRGFQKHKRRRIELDPFVNCLICKTDGGKSSAIRALRWCLTNQPDGIRFINWDSKFAKVSVGVDGHRISRKRGPGVNEYRLDGKAYRAFGNAVPEEIAKLVNVGPVSFQGQHQLPFFFSDTPGQVSKNLNSIVNLSVIDSSLANVAASVRKARAVKEVAKERLRSAKTRSEALDWVKSLDRLLKAAEATRGALDEAESDMVDLDEAAIRLAELERKRSPVPDLSRLDAAKEKLESADNLVKVLEADVTELEAKEGELCETQKAANRARTSLQKIEKGRTCPICQRPLNKGS